MLEVSLLVPWLLLVLLVVLLVALIFHLRSPRIGRRSRYGRGGQAQRRAALPSRTGSLRSRLLRELRGDRGAAERLMSHARLSHPGQSEQWYYEKVIYDLERD